jgi:type I restriction enzyme S subunit
MESVVLPPNWKILKISECGEVIRGASPRPQGDARFYGGDVPRLMVEDITRDKHWITPSVDFLTLEGSKLSRFCPKGTLILVCSGTPNAVGLPGLLAIDACIHDGILGLIKTKDFISSEYLYYCLSSNQRKLFDAATHGGTFVNLTTDSFRAFTIILPSTKSEQTSIATALSDVDALITSLERLIAKKRNIKYGAMHQLLKPKKGWVTKKLGEIANFYKGRGLPKSSLIENGKYKCIHYGELFTKYKELISSIISHTDENENSFYSKSNDVLMPTSDVTPNGLATASCIKEDGVILGGDILVIRLPEKELDGVFLCYYISKNKEEVMSMVTGSTVYHLYGSDMKKLTVTFPPIQDQQFVASILSDVDAEIVALEKKLNKIKRLKEGMMQNLLTGKIRLN